MLGEFQSLRQSNIDYLLLSKAPSHVCWQMHGRMPLEKVDMGTMWCRVGIFYDPLQVLPGLLDGIRHPLHFEGFSYTSIDWLLFPRNILAVLLNSAGFTLFLHFYLSSLCLYLYLLFLFCIDHHTI